MSKWIKKELFEKHLEEREKEKSQQQPKMIRSEKVWPSPKPGTTDEPETYQVRFLPDPKGKLMKKYYYHLWRSGDKWFNVLCPKTHEFSNWCPICSAVSALYNGSEEDKKIARDMKRKERFVANIYVVDDPRDKNAKDDASKMNKKVRLYEFPSKVAEKIEQENDPKEGLQEAVWDAGAEGHDFIIKIKLTKPDGNKNQFPEYASSIFSRKSSPIGTDAEIEEILKTTHDVEEHISLMEKDDKWMKETITSEGLFKLIEREWNKRHSSPNVQVTEGEDDVPFDVTEKNGQEPEKAGSISDEDILKELEGMKM
jgi:hypothetical protein